MAVSVATNDEKVRKIAGALSFHILKMNMIFRYVYSICCLVVNLQPGIVINSFVIFPLKLPRDFENLS